MNNNKLSAKNIAFNKIRDMILANELTDSEIINENELAKELQISRTPIREALNRLESEGYIRIFPNRGAMVIRLDVSRIVQICQVREGLERVAIRIACKNINIKKIKQIREELVSIEGLDDTANMERAFQCGQNLHSEIINCTGNDILIRYMENMNAQMSRITATCRTLKENAKEIKQEHLNIIDALLEEDCDRAERAILNHIIGVEHEVVDMFKRDLYE